MTNPKAPIDEWIATFRSGYENKLAYLSGGRFKEDEDICLEAGLLAVIEKHVGPMLEDAYESGAIDGAGVTELEGKDFYALRILAQLKGETNDETR